MEITDQINVFESDDRSNPTLLIASRDDLIKKVHDRNLRYPLIYCDEKLFVEEVGGKKKKHWGVNFRVLRNVEQGGDEWTRFLDKAAKEMLQVLGEEYDLAGIRLTYEWEEDQPVHKYIKGILNGGKSDMIV